MEVSWQSKMILLHGCSRTWTWGKSENQPLGDDEKFLEKNNGFYPRKIEVEACRYEKSYDLRYLSG